MPRRTPLRPLGALLLGTAALVVTPSGTDAQERPRPGTVGPRRPPPPVTAPTTRRPAPPAPRPVDSLRTMALHGLVYDSLNVAPMAGATVQLASESDRSVTFTTQSDSLGRWRVNGVRPGRYLAGFYHPSLDGLGIDPPVLVVDVQPDTAARLDLGSPGAQTLRARLCPQASPDRAVLLGAVTDAEAGGPVAESKVVITWSEMRIDAEGVRNAKRRLPLRVRPDGGYLACDLPADVDLVANAEAPRRRGGLIELRLPQRGLTRRDFALGDSGSVVTVLLPDTLARQEGRLEQPIAVARGRSVLTGSVRTRDGRPVANARVQLWGSDVAGTTGENGSFSLSGLPSGTYALDVRVLGYQPKRVAVNLASSRPATVSVTMDERVNTMQSVVVQADRTKLQKDYTGFLERSKRGGMGRYIDQEAIDRRNAIQASDVFRTLPGIQVVPNGGGFGYAIQGRGNCQPDVFIDGMRVFDGATDLDQLVRPVDLAGIEVYNGAATVPAQFAMGSRNACAVVAIWTKRGR